MGESSEAIKVANDAQDDTSAGPVSLDVEESYELALKFWRDARYGAARAMVWPYTRPKSARSVDVVVCMTNMLGVIDWSAREYARAIRTLKTVEPLVSTLSDRVLQGKYFGTCALCEQYAGRHDSALLYFKDAFDCYKLAGARRYADDIENNIGVLHIQAGRPELADPFITRALQSCDDPLTLAQILDTRAKQELAFGHYDEARELNRESMGILYGLQGVDVYLASFARTSVDIDRAEIEAMNKTFSRVTA